VANNLAWVIAFNMKPPDLDRALALVNLALSKEEKPEFHGTRGHILAEMGRDREAMNDLESAKAAYANSPKQAHNLFARLAKVYGNLGLKSEADHNQKLAEQKWAEYLRTPAGRNEAAAAAASQSKPPTSPGATGPEKKESTGAPPAPKP
jgi:hypothetical protein